MNKTVWKQDMAYLFNRSAGVGASDARELWLASGPHLGPSHRARCANREAMMSAREVMQALSAASGGFSEVTEKDCP